MRRWTAFVVAVCTLLVIGFTVDQVGDDTALALFLGLIPVVFFVVASYRARAASLGVLTVVLVLYTLLWIAGTLSYDSTSTASLVLLFFPLYGVLAMLVVLAGRGLFAVVRLGRRSVNRSTP